MTGHGDNFGKSFEKVTALEAAVAGKATATPAALKPPEVPDTVGEIIEASHKPTPKVTADDWITKLSSVHPKGVSMALPKNPPKIRKSRQRKQWTSLKQGTRVSQGTGVANLNPRRWNYFLGTISGFELLCFSGQVRTPG